MNQRDFGSLVSFDRSHRDYTGPLIRSGGFFRAIAARVKSRHGYLT